MFPAILILAHYTVLPVHVHMVCGHEVRSKIIVNSTSCKGCYTMVLVYKEHWRIIMCYAYSWSPEFEQGVETPRQRGSRNLATTFA